MMARYTAILLCVVSMSLGCPALLEDPPQVYNDFETKGRVGEPYRLNADNKVHLATMTKQPYWFIRCRTEDRWRVDRATGAIDYTPEEPGTVEFCIEVRNEKPGRRVSWTVDVAPRKDELPEKLSGDLTEYLGKLIALGQTVARIEKPVTRKCLESEGDDGGAIYPIEEELLSALAKGEEPPKETPPWTVWHTLFGAGLAKVVEAKAKKQSPPVKDLGPKTIREWATRTRVAVIRTEQRNMPQLVAANTFKEGEFRGWLFVGDLGGARVLCQAPLTFKSSNTVEWQTTISEWVRNSDDVAKAKIDRDLAQTAKGAMRSALDSISDKLTLRYHGE